MKLETVKILKIKKETPTVRTFTINKKFNAIPGQFAMVWIPDVGEKPFGFSRVDENLEITVKNIGEFTNKLFSLSKGDLIGIRGPYGNGFRIDGKAKNFCIISGGVGISPLMPFIENLRKANKNVTVIMGAKTKNELLFADRIKKTKADLLITTDDRTEGNGGFCTDILPDVIKDKKNSQSEFLCPISQPEKFAKQIFGPIEPKGSIGKADSGKRIDIIYTCGPEVMMKKVTEISEKFGIPCQLSMERYMKCGIGICGSCAIDPSGLLVCRDGPVFDAKDLKNSEFGKYRRDADGGKVFV